jgi:hypothetical protein
MSDGQKTEKKKLTINKTTLRRLTDPTLAAGAPGAGVYFPDTCSSTSVFELGHCAEGRN